MTTAKDIQRQVQSAIEDGREHGPSMLVEGDRVTVMHAGHAHVETVVSRGTNFYGDELWVLAGSTPGGISLQKTISIDRKDGHAEYHSMGGRVCSVPPDRISRVG